VAAQAPASAPAAPPVAVQAPAPSAPAAAPAAAPKAKRTQPLSPRLAPTPAASAVPPPPFRASKAAAGPKDVAHGHETSRDQQAVDNLNPPGTSRMEHRAHISQDLTTEAPKDWRCTEAAGVDYCADHAALCDSLFCPSCLLPGACDYTCGQCVGTAPAERRSPCSQTLASATAVGFGHAGSCKASRCKAPRHGAPGGHSEVCHDSSTYLAPEPEAACAVEDCQAMCIAKHAGGEAVHPVTGKVVAASLPACSHYSYSAETRRCSLFSTCLEIEGGGEAASFDTFAIGPPPPPPPPVDWEDAPAETVSAVAQQAAQAAVEKVGVLWRSARHFFRISEESMNVHWEDSFGDIADGHLNAPPGLALLFALFFFGVLPTALLLVACKLCVLPCLRFCWKCRRVRVHVALKEETGSMLQQANAARRRSARRRSSSSSSSCCCSSSSSSR